MVVFLSEGMGEEEGKLETRVLSISELSCALDHRITSTASLWYWTFNEQYKLRLVYDLSVFITASYEFCSLGKMRGNYVPRYSSYKCVLMPNCH